MWAPCKCSAFRVRRIPQRAWSSPGRNGVVLPPCVLLPCLASACHVQEVRRRAWRLSFIPLPLPLVLQSTGEAAADSLGLEPGAVCG